jgi:hypothetical protein
MSDYDYEEATVIQQKLMDNYDPWARKVKLSEQVDKGMSALQCTGTYCNAHLILSVNPVDTDTIGIGVDTYEFDDDGAVTPGRIAVTIGALPADTRANLIAAINSQGLEQVVATEYTDQRAVIVRKADRVGGDPIVGYYSILLTENITDGADVWNQAVLAATGIFHGGRTAYDYVAIDAINVVTPFLIMAPFAYNQAVWTARDSNYVAKPTTAIVAPAVGIDNAVLVTPTNGANPLVATDVLVIEFFE